MVSAVDVFAGASALLVAHLEHRLVCAGLGCGYFPNILCFCAYQQKILWNSFCDSNSPYIIKKNILPGLDCIENNAIFAEEKADLTLTCYYETFRLENDCPFCDAVFCCRS